MRIYLIAFLAFFVISCGRNFKHSSCECSYSVSVEGNWSISKEEVFASMSSVLKQSEKSLYDIEIVIFSYSSGKEVFYYLNDSPKDNPDNIIIKTSSGNINALVKFKEDKSLRKVIFFNAEGNSKAEILQGLAREIQRAVCNKSD